MITEPLSKIAEAEILRTRKRLVGDKSIPLESGVISQNLLALSRLASDPARKFAGLIEAARGIFGLTSARALEMRKAIREGTLKEADLQGFLDKLMGRDQ